MWLFISVRNPDSKFILLVGREYSIGRRDADIVVPNDMSISRKHAIIRIVHPESNIAAIDKTPQLVYKDVSKLGTLLRGERITNTETERLVNNGDCLELGTAGVSHYKCVYESMIITTSCLDHGAKRTLKSNVCKLGGHVVGEWINDCSLVVMSKLQVTVKVICALVCLKHVVTPQYVADVTLAVETGTKLPDPGDYQPPLSEAQVNPSEVSFKPDTRRRSLFEGKKFIFLVSSQFEKMHAVISLAGGSAILAEERGVAGVDDGLLVNDCTCVMRCDAAATQSSQAAHSWIKYVHQLLTRHGRRMITDSEIGFAILYCTTATHCNPLSVSESNSSHGLPMHTLSIPQTSQMVSQLPPDDKATSSVTQNEFAVPATPVIATVQVKQEPLSQQSTELNCQKQAVSVKRVADSDGNKQRGKQMRLDTMFAVSRKQLVQGDGVRQQSASVEISSTTCSMPNSREKPDEDSLSAQPSHVRDLSKIETTFVAESIAADSSETNLFDELPSRLSVSKRNVLCSTLKEVKTEVFSQTAIECPDSQPAGSLLQQDVPTLPVRGRIDERRSLQSLESFSSVSRNVLLSETDVTCAPDGFLCAHASRKIPRDETVVKDENLPDGITIVEEKDLIMRRLSNRLRVVVSANYAAVKNFKTFKKSSQFNGLPRIIGGSDLVAHQCMAFVGQNQLGVFSQPDFDGERRNIDRMAEELVSWEPSRRKKL